MNPYLILKLVHVLAVIIFLGNIITGLFWMHIAVRTKELRIISFTMKGIIKADRYFTIPGVIIITAGGILAASRGEIPIWQTGWIFWSIVLFSVSGIIFSIKLAPLQKKIYKLSMVGEATADFDWKYFNKVFKQWDTWGLVAVATPLSALVMMVLKIPVESGI